MRTILFAAVVIVLLSLLGWMTFEYGNGRASISVDTDKAQKDTEKVIDKATDAIHDATDADGTVD